MLLFYFGNDFSKKNKEVQKTLNKLKQQRENSNFIHYDSYDINEEHLKELLKSQGLFDKKNIVFLSNVFFNNDLKKWIIENIEEFKNSESAFIFSEDNITVFDKKKIEKFAFKFEEFKENKKIDINIWQLSNYIQKKDKKNIWLFFQEILNKNISIDEIFPIIFWSIKNLNIVKNFKIGETNLKPYQYTSSKNNLNKWNDNQIENKLLELIKIHSESRRGKLNLKNSVEKFLLEL